MRGWSSREHGTSEAHDAQATDTGPRRPATEASDDDGRRPVLSVRLLGGVSATWMGREVHLPTRGARALLALLAVQPQPRLRESIASDLWPDAGDSSAARLRQALWQLRRAFVAAGAGPRDVLRADVDRLGLRGDVDRLGLRADVDRLGLRGDVDRLGLRGDVGWDLDVVRFRSLLDTRPPDLGAALRLYRGEYAEGLDLECFAADRVRLADLYEDALAQLAHRCLAEGDLACARTASLDLIARDPLREEAHATLIEVFGRSGSRDQVIRQYRRLVRLLDRELGIEPLAETQESFRSAIRRTGLRSAQAVARRAFGPVERGAWSDRGSPSDLGPG